MWNITGKPANFSRFQPFEPAEVLYEFDGPRIFTLIDNDDELNLVYWSDENDQICRYVVVPTTEKILTALKKRSISVFEALNQPRCWLCDSNQLGELTDCQRVEFEDIWKRQSKREPLRQAEGCRIGNRKGNHFTDA